MEIDSSSLLPFSVLIFLCGLGLGAGIASIIGQSNNKKFGELLDILQKSNEFKKKHPKRPIQKFDEMSLITQHAELNFKLLEPKNRSILASFIMSEAALHSEIEEIAELLSKGEFDQLQEYLLRDAENIPDAQKAYTRRVLDKGKQLGESIKKGAKTVRDKTMKAANRKFSKKAEEYLGDGDE